MNGAMRPLVMSSPLASPHANPDPTATPMAAATARGGETSAIALSSMIPSEPTKAAMEPTDRSMPPDTITKVIPRAMIPVYETWRRMLSRFCHCRKYGLRNDESTVRSTSATTAA